jgi:hypothetical protein
VDLVHEHELGDDGSYLERLVGVQIGDVANDQILAVIPQGEALIEETADIVVMTGQFD